MSQKKEVKKLNFIVRNGITIADRPKKYIKGKIINGRIVRPNIDRIFEKLPRWRRKKILFDDWWIWMSKEDHILCTRTGCYWNTRVSTPLWIPLSKINCSADYTIFTWIRNIWDYILNLFNFKPSTKYSGPYDFDFVYVLDVPVYMHRNRNFIYNDDYLFNKTSWKNWDLMGRILIGIYITLLLFGPWLTYLIKYVIYTLIVLNSKSSGNESMDSILILYMEILFVCSFIVYIVLETLFFVENHFSRNYIFNDHLFEEDIEKQSFFSYVTIKFTALAESFLDVVFLTFPTVVIVFVVIPTLGFIYHKDVNIENGMYYFSVHVVGHQWYWTYIYGIDFFQMSDNLLPIEQIKKLEFDSIMIQQDESISFSSETKINTNRLLRVDNVLVLPVMSNIKLTFSSDDVIHSWAVPQLGIKVDAIPGRITSANLYTYASATFHGQCSELCGVNHAFMPICIEVLPYDLFVDWYWQSICLELSTHRFDFFFDTYYRYLMKPKDISLSTLLEWNWNLLLNIKYKIIYNNI